MSSSEPTAFELPDLRQPERAQSGRAFVETNDFQHVESSAVRPRTAEEAYADGIAEGEARGRAAMQKELEPVLEELRAIGQAMAAVRSERLAQTETELTELAAQITRRILTAELSQNPDAVVRLAQACVDEARERDGQMRMRVSPGDLERVRVHLPELQLDLVDGSIELTADPELSPGDVVLEAAERCYDGRPGHRLRRALAAATSGGET